MGKLDQYCDSCESLFAALGTAAGTPSLCIGNEVIGGGAPTVGFFAAGAPGGITFCSGVTLLLNRCRPFGIPVYVVSPVPPVPEPEQI